MKANQVRQLGQAVTALSAVIIAFATLSPDTGIGATNDTIAHFLLFLPLGAGGALWMANLEPATQRRARLAMLGVILAFAAGTELAQVAMEERTGSLSDFIADAAGGGVGLLIGGWIASRARRSP